MSAKDHKNYPDFDPHLEIHLYLDLDLQLELDLDLTQLNMTYLNLY